MSAVTASAPGKIILFGEHAVVYGQPAIAVPVTQVQARCTVVATPTAPTGRVEIDAPDIGVKSSLDELSPTHPLALPIHLVREQLGIRAIPACRLRITSTIPIASGLGSGAAVSVAMARAISTFLGHPLTTEQISSIAFRVDQTYHGIPSGIDNTVITYNQPIFFTRGEPFERLTLRHPFWIVIGNSGIASPTVTVVEEVRRRYQASPSSIEPTLLAIGKIARQARVLLESNDPGQLGALLTENHQRLQELGVSCPELDHLVNAALQNGALGAKLSGGGRGGNMIALVTKERANQVAEALRRTGAVSTLLTQIG